MNLLAIDTSTERASVALLINGCYSRLEQTNQRQHAQWMLPMIEQLLSDAGLSITQLDGLVMGRGPGSFTGLRITCSLVQGLACAHDLPVYPVSSLAAIADEVFYQQPALPADQTVLTLIDARMNQVYWACYDSSDAEVLEQVSNMTDVYAADSKPLILAGAGYQHYIKDLSDAVAGQVIQELEIFPQAEAMLRLVAAGKIKPVTAEQALPVYIRNQITGVSGG